MNLASAIIVTAAKWLLMTTGCLVCAHMATRAVYLAGRAAWRAAGRFTRRCGAPLEHVHGDALDRVDDTVRGITDAEVEEHLAAVVLSTGGLSPPAVLTDAQEEALGWLAASTWTVAEYSTMIDATVRAVAFRDLDPAERAQLERDGLDPGQIEAYFRRARESGTWREDI